MSSCEIFISPIDVFWQFYLEEAKGRVDYQGYIFPRRRGEIVSISVKLDFYFPWIVIPNIEIKFGALNTEK